MKQLLMLAVVAAMLGACGISIPNGVFSCVGPPDCPEGYFCWNSDGRCYDTKEPEPTCTPSSCEDVIAEFASLGVVVECGVLPDGCEGSVECPPCDDGNACGANGQSFLCGCEPMTCSSEEAECGLIDPGCGLDSIDCGACLGGLECLDHKCVCPDGQDCNAPCGGCLEGEVCVEGQCCMPLFPCVDNECSPPGGLPDGCGGLVECAPCAAGSDCELEETGNRFECVNNCTCEAQGIECGAAPLCGTTRYCGECGNPDAPLCDGGLCVCRDGFEVNDEPKTASEVPCKGDCKVGTLHAEVEGTLDRAADFDFYAIEVPHRSDRAIRVDVSGLESTSQLVLTYRCPDGTNRIESCSGSNSSFGESAACIEDDNNVLRLVQGCFAPEGAPAKIVVGIGSKPGEFRGPCDEYRLTVSSYSYVYDD